MTNKTIGVQGLAKLEADMRKFAPMMVGKKGYPKNVLRNASRAMANKAKDHAKQRAPVDTGRLRNSIKIKLISTKYRDKVTGRGDSIEFYYLGYDPGDSRKDRDGAYYGGMIEVGTDRLPARPYLRPAVEENQSGLVGEFTTKLSKDIALIARKLAKGA